MTVFSRFCAVLLCMGVFCWRGAGASEPAPEPDASDCFLAGFEARSADAVALCYAEDAIMWFPGGPMAQGRAAIRDGFAHFFDGVTVKGVELTTIGRETLGDTRVAWGTYAIRVVDKATGAESVQRGRFTDVQKRINGRWLYTVDHPSDDPAQ